MKPRLFQTSSKHKSTYVGALKSNHALFGGIELELEGIPKIITVTVYMSLSVQGQATPQHYRQRAEAQRHWSPSCVYMYVSSVVSASSVRTCLSRLHLQAFSRHQGRHLRRRLGTRPVHGGSASGVTRPLKNRGPQILLKCIYI